MNNDLEALAKLDEAIQALKEAGYEFREHTCRHTVFYDAGKDTSKRVISVCCYKYFPVVENEEVTAIRKLNCFSQISTC